MGKTIAEFGAGNTPLDMIAYTKGGQNFIMMSNTRHGILKFAADGLDKFEAITTPVSGTGGVPAETIAGLTGVEQLDRFDAQRAVILTRTGTTLDLKTVALP
jgi:hypothetical protein